MCLVSLKVAWYTSKISLDQCLYMLSIHFVRKQYFILSSIKCSLKMIFYRTKCHGTNKSSYTCIQYLKTIKQYFVWLPEFQRAGPPFHIFLFDILKLYRWVVIKDFAWFLIVSVGKPVRLLSHLSPWKLLFYTWCRPQCLCSYPHLPSGPVQTLKTLVRRRDLGLLCLPRSPKRDAGFIWVKPFPFGVLGRIWNSIVSDPDHCVFIYRALWNLAWRFSKPELMAMIFRL